MATVALTRIALVAAMGVVLAIVAGAVFDDLHWPVLVGPPLVAVGAALVTGRTWVVRVAAGVLAVSLGVALTVMLAGGAVTDAFPGVLSGPRRLLSTEWPSPGEPSVVGSVALLVSAATALAADLAGRARFHLAPLGPIVVAVAALLALGAPVRPARWTTITFALLAVSFMLLRPGTSLGQRRRAFLAERTVAVSAIAMAAVAVATSTAIAWSDRADPRRVEDAEVVAALVDPIEAAVALRDLEPSLALFTVTDRSTLIGRSLPSRWRIAALDTYDGQRWVPRLTLRPIGGRLGLPAAPRPDAAPPIRYELRFLTDDFDLVPLPGRPLEVSADVATDTDRVVVRLAEPPAPGTTITARSEVAPTSDAGGVIATRQVDDLAGGFTELTANLAGDGTVIERLRRIERTMRDEWRLDPDAPGGGHQLALIDRFVNDTRRGTEEQFVTAFVLLVRSLGFDARVATGFVVPPDELGTPLTLTSRHATIWPEIRLVGSGWLPFDPAPARPAVEQEEPLPPPEAQSPAAAQPPIAPPAESGDDDDQPLADTDRSGGRWATLRTWATRVGAVAGVSLGPLALAIAAVLLAKLVRRRRRLRSDDPVRRIRGAWANATDSLVDAGLSIVPSWTDDRIAVHAAAVAPTAPHEARRLAAMAAVMTFGPTDDGWRLADDAVLTSAAIDAAIRAERTRWQRIRWRLSLRSLRRATRSPVAD